MPKIRIATDDQPISSRFFGEAKWLTEFVTPESLEVNTLYKKLTEGQETLEEKLIACWYWVADKVRYKKFITGTLRIEGKAEYQNDLWCDPSLTIRTKVGNCANKAFLLTSLLRWDLPADNVFCVLGNLNNNGDSGGHAWCQVNLGGADYIMESTRPDVPHLIKASIATKYEAVHLFNDKEVFYVEGMTVMEPFTAAYSPWLKDYLDWSYIKGQGQK